MIKKFEEFNQTFDSDQSYEINRDDFFNNYKSRFTLAPKIKARLKRLLTKDWYISYQIRNQIYIRCYVYGRRIRYSLFLGDDEWWYVCEDTPKGIKYYKCDQWDGLLHFLKSKGVV